MQCPLKIVKNGNSSDGNQLMCQFDKSNFPAKVRVISNGKPTDDVEATNGKSGVWTSRDKYTTTAISLQLLDAAGVVMNTCNYDVSGQPAATKKCVVKDFDTSFDGSSTSVITWTSVEEVGMAAYVLERYDSDTLDKNQLVPESELKGPGQSYRKVDDEVYSIPSNYKYKLFAIFKDNTKVLVAERALIALPV